jgi:hypothetical protein
MSSADATPSTALSQEAAEALKAAMEILDAGAIDSVADEAIQQLLLAGTKLYFAKRDSGSKLAAFPGPEGVTASEVATACVGMTEVVNLELFELALWAAWSNV